MQFSSRFDHIRASAVRELFDIGRRIPDAVDLSIGQVGFPVPVAAREAAIQAINAGSGRYSPTEGRPEVVSAVKDHLIAADGLSPDEHVMLTVGATGALTLAFLALAGPGDEVLIPDPHFVIYPNLARISGATPVFYDTYPDMQPTAAGIADLITERTRMVVLNNPANPTGTVFSRSCVEEITNLCARKGIALVSDELHARFVYGREHVSVKRFDHDNSLLIGGLSKTYGMAGWRIGWAAGPSELIDKMRMLQQFTYTCPPTLVQAAVPGALASDMSPWVEKHRKKSERAWEVLTAAGYEVVKPGGTIFMYPKVPEGTDLEFCRRAMEHKVIVVPGSAFSMRNTHFRVCIAAEDETLDRGLEALVSLAR